MEKKTYKVELDIETMQDIKDLIYFCNEHFPYTKSSLWKVNKEFENIILNGCFKHNILRENFNTGENSSISICRLCNPKKYSKLKKEGKLYE